MMLRTENRPRGVPGPRLDRRYNPAVPTRLTHLLPVVVALSLSLSAPQAQPADSTTDHRLEQAMAAIRAGRVDAAVAELEALREQLPGLSAVHHVLGLAYEKQDRHAAAATSLERALELEPTRLAALAPLAWSQFYLGRSDEARVNFRRYLEIAPGDARAHLGLGLVEAEAGNSDRARIRFLETIQLTHARGDDDSEALARAALADVELRQGNLITATRLLEAAIALRPTDAALHLKLAHVLDIGGETEAAAAARAEHARLEAEATRR